MKRLTESQRQDLCRQYVVGVPTAQIAKNFGVSQSYPSQLAAKYNLTRRHSAEHCEAIAVGSRTSLAQSPVIEIAEPVEAAAPAAPMNVAEIRRLAGMGRRRTEIAALLRCPYRVVDAALS